jgi:hypothetical protein
MRFSVLFAAFAASLAASLMFFNSTSADAQADLDRCKFVGDQRYENDRAGSRCGLEQPVRMVVGKKGFR